MLAIAQGDLTEASGLVVKGVSYAQDAEKIAGGDAPASWNDVSNNLKSASSNVQNSLSSA
jgi:hypothetical protein